jgi:O-antigen/teichoic acid export membrane protein
MNEAALDTLTSHKILVRNTILSFSTQGIPILIAFFAIPLIIKGLGNERFSILTLIWAVIGYSGLLDFGMGHALTQLVSKKLGTGDTKDLQTVVCTALTMMFVFGVFACIFVSLLAPVMVTKILKIPPIYISETLHSFYLLALTLPLLILNFSLTGILEAHQKFDIITKIRIPIIICNYLGPLVVLFFHRSLLSIVICLVVIRIISFIAHLNACLKLIKLSKLNFDFSYIKPLLNFGSWVTVSNIINPLMVYMDRFFIASIISATLIIYYTTPHEVITKLWIIPNAIMSVMFPAFSAQFAKNRERTRELYYQSLKYIIVLLFPIVIITIIFAKFGLSLWLSEAFAEKSYVITQILAIGVFLYGFNQPSFNLIQASGRADITAKLHLLELPVYLFLLWTFIKIFGLSGAAIAWLVRIIIDTIALNIIAMRLIRN